MASSAFESSDPHDESRPPISLHPAFPAIVGLWFAALLGLGSMIVPVTLIERFVEATGLAALVPAASPPLGFMARGLIALASAVAGAGVGIAIARRVARTHDAGGPSRAARFVKGARRPIDVNEEIGGEGLINGFGLPVSHRRALAIAEDDRPSDFLYMAPLPGRDEDECPPAFDKHPMAPAVADEPFELSDAFEDSLEAGEEPPMTFAQEFQPLPPEPRAEARQEFGPAPSRGGRAEPLPFSAPSLARRAVEAEAPAIEPEPAVPEPHEPVQLEPAPAASEPQPSRSDWSNAPLAELGLVQLVQRLGASLERRREWLVSVDASAPPPRLVPAAGFDPAPAEEAAQAMAAYFGKPSCNAEGENAVGDEPQPASPAPASALPNLLGPWPVPDDEDEFDAMPSFTLALRKAVAPTIAFDDPDVPENDDEIEDAGVEETDDSYSSLLAMRGPFTAKGGGLVGVEEPAADDDAVEPAVAFPGHGESAVSSATAGQAGSRTFDSPSGADADAALRAALATLQRMSGTA